MAISFCHSRNTDPTLRHSLLVGEPIEELVGETDGEKGRGVQVGHDLVQDLSRQPARRREASAEGRDSCVTEARSSWDKHGMDVFI